MSATELTAAQKSEGRGELPSLRDRFAAAALTGLASIADLGARWSAERAAIAYQLADMMLEERVKRVKADVDTAVWRCRICHEVALPEDPCVHDGEQVGIYREDAT